MIAGSKEAVYNRAEREIEGMGEPVKGRGGVGSLLQDQPEGEGKGPEEQEQEGQDAVAAEFGGAPVALKVDFWWKGFRERRGKATVLEPRAAERVPSLEMISRVFRSAQPAEAVFADAG